jgi:hypothetical protein
VQPTFTAPNTSGPITFTLTVTDAFGAASLPDSVRIVVQNHEIFLPLVLKDF